jgi:HK97 family phage major capsid protein
MQPNTAVIQKANLALGDLAPGGLLVPKQAARFLQIAIKKNVLTSAVRTPTMTHPEERQPKMLWTGRVLHPASGGTALTDAQRSKPTMDRVVLISNLAKAEVHTDREVLEDQVERQGFKRSLLQYLAKKVSADLEDLLINGDTANTTDAWLAYVDGLIKLAVTNVLTPGGPTSLTADELRDLIQAMPEEFDDQPNLRFYTNRKARSDYRSSVRTRATVGGDAIIYGGAPGELGYDGVPLTRVPRFPNNLGAGTNETRVLYMDPKNAIMGFQRKVTMESEFRISEQVWVVVVTLRVAINFEHEPAVAKAEDIYGQ